MDQLKEYLRQAVKYRFWIAIGIACLLPIIAKFVGTGALAAAEKDQVTKIKGAKEGAKKYTTGIVENGPWKDQVVEKTDLLAKDVQASHEKLYGKQEPILDWPKAVVSTIAAWGEKYPTEWDVQKVNDEIQTYTEVYDAYVDTVYQTFKPFDLKTGTGIVAAPPKELLLQPMIFKEEVRPSLTEVWSAQRKLWIERTLFDVIAKVNAKAKDWDSAPIKQIVMMEVANGFALDQKTAAKPDELIDAPGIAGDPSAAPPPDKAAPAADVGGRFSAGIAASKTAAGAGAGAGASDSAQFVKSPNPEQYYIVPVALSVYIEQDRIPDLLVAFRNSPMTIRVLDFEMRRPRSAVKKPKKGEESESFAGAMAGGRGRAIMGGFAGSDETGGGAMASMSNMNSGQDAYKRQMARTKGGGVMNPGVVGKTTVKTREGGKDVKAENAKKIADKNRKGTDKDKKDATKTDEEPEMTLSNPYFNVVQVTIRGQARFYKAPKKAATPEPNPSAKAPETAKAEAPKADAAKAEAPKADAAKAEAPKADAEAPKADAAKAEAPKGDAAKADAPKAEDSKADAPKADDTKADAPKAEAKADAPKVETPKAEAPKTDAPKSDTPKTDAEKPKS
jgi:hypothetical protein